MLLAGAQGSQHRWGQKVWPLVLGTYVLQVWVPGSSAEAGPEALGSSRHWLCEPLRPMLVGPSSGSEGVCCGWPRWLQCFCLRTDCVQLRELGSARLLQSVPGTQTESPAWWRPCCCPGDLKIVFGKSCWCALIPTRHYDDDDIGKGKRVKASPGVQG